jgi:hypothetical protein
MMIENTIAKIERKIKRNSFFTDQNKIELLNLLATLKVEVSNFSEDQIEHAESMVGFIDQSTHEVMRREKNPELIKFAMGGLIESVKGFEVTHPQLVENVNYIANTLAKMGI